MALPAASAQSSEFVKDLNVVRIRYCVSVTRTADERWINTKHHSERIDYTAYMSVKTRRGA